MRSSWWHNLYHPTAPPPTQLRPTRYFSPTSHNGRSSNNLAASSQPPNSLDELNPANLIATFGNGIVQGFVEQLSKSSTPTSGTSSSSNNNPFLAGGTSNSNGNNDLNNILLRLNLNGNARSATSVSSSPPQSTNDFLAALLYPNSGSNNKNSAPSSQNIFGFSLASLTTTTTASPPTRKLNLMRSLISRLFPGIALHREARQSHHHTNSNKRSRKVEIIEGN